MTRWSLFLQTLSLLLHHFLGLYSYQGDFEGQQVRFLKTIKVIHLSPVEQGAGINTATLDIKCANCNGSDSTRTGAYRLELGTEVLQEAIKEMADAATQTGECPVCGGHIEAKSESKPQPDPWLEYSNYRMEMLRRKAFVLGE